VAALAAVGAVDGLVDAVAPAVAIALTGAVLVLTVLAGIRRQRHGRLQTAET
jgi:hypothetical protein